MLSAEINRCFGQVYSAWHHCILLVNLKFPRGTWGWGGCKTDKHYRPYLGIPSGCCDSWVYWWFRAEFTPFKIKCFFIPKWFVFIDLQGVGYVSSNFPGKTTSWILLTWSINDPISITTSKKKDSCCYYAPFQLACVSTVFCLVLLSTIQGKCFDSEMASMSRKLAKKECLVGEFRFFTKHVDLFFWLGGLAVHLTLPLKGGLKNHGFLSTCSRWWCLSLRGAFIATPIWVVK